MLVARTIAEVRKQLSHGPGVAFVPTMGALHRGHVSLMERAGQMRPRVVVSIFVNPTQFGPNEDFSKYPRPLEKDLELCRAAGVDLVFLPEVAEIFPSRELPVLVDIPDLTGTLEASHRPGHFGGVCRVVAKLLHIVKPAVACFGEKDYQQLAVIRAMVQGLNMDVAIEPCPTLREADGLAMSSRNVYLTPDQRLQAVGLYKAILQAEKMIQEGETRPGSIEREMANIVAGHGFELDYAVVRDAQSLRPVEAVRPSDRPVVCLLAARLGAVRLIDNRVFAS